jgi:hypothetical protein
MEIKKCIKESFSVVGKEGSTNDGDGFIQKLWEDANNHYNEIVALVKTDKNGNPVGFWGAMSDFSRSFKPWEYNLSKGIYPPAQRSKMIQKHLMGGLNGQFRHMNFFMLKLRTE